MDCQHMFLCQLCSLSTLIVVNFVRRQLCSFSTLFVVNFVGCQICLLPTLSVVNFVHRQLCSPSTLFAVNFVGCQLCLQRNWWIVNTCFFVNPSPNLGAAFLFWQATKPTTTSEVRQDDGGEEHPQCQSDYCWSLLITLLSRYIPLILWLESSAEPKCLSTLLFQGHFSHLWWSAFSRKPPDSRIFSVTYFELDTWPGVVRDMWVSDGDP